MPENSTSCCRAPVRPMPRQPPPQTRRSAGKGPAPNPTRRFRSQRDNASRPDFSKSSPLSFLAMGFLLAIEVALARPSVFHSSLASSCQIFLQHDQCPHSSAHHCLNKLNLIRTFRIVSYSNCGSRARQVSLPWNTPHH